MSAWRRRRIERKLTRFIVEELLDELHDGRDPLATEAVDSLGREQLIDYIQQEFGVSIGEREIADGSFDSIPVLVTMLDAKQRAVR